MVNRRDIDRMLNAIADEYGVSVNDFHKINHASMDEVEQGVDSSMIYTNLLEEENIAQEDLREIGFDFSWVQPEDKCVHVYIEELIPVTPTQDMLVQLSKRVWNLVRVKMLLQYLSHNMGWGGALGYWREDLEYTVLVHVTPYDNEGDIFTLGCLWNRDIGAKEYSYDDIDDGMDG